MCYCRYEIKIKSEYSILKLKKKKKKKKSCTNQMGIGSEMKVKQNETLLE